MHNSRLKRSISDYAKILIVMAFALLIYGIILDYSNEVHLIEPESVINNSDKGNIYVDTHGSNDDNRVPNDFSDVQEKLQDSNTAATSVEETNNVLRNDLQKKYGITIKYGSEIGKYVVGGYSTNAINDPMIINDSLNRLKDSLKLYPDGIFDEIKNKGGIYLSIYLVDNYSDDIITGITDSNTNSAIISVAVTHPFEETFYHETYHYFERYMFIRGVNFNNWSIYNPSGFTYGVINKDYSYTSTYSQNAYFVNSYAQYSAEEDRASTFEYMMASNKALCMNQGTPVWIKAKVMKEAIEASFSTVSPKKVEYWERFI